MGGLTCLTALTIIRPDSFGPGELRIHLKAGPKPPPTNGFGITTHQESASSGTRAATLKSVAYGGTIGIPLKFAAILVISELPSNLTRRPQ
jgi:hypothetical protein